MNIIEAIKTAGTEKFITRGVLESLNVKFKICEEQLLKVYRNNKMLIKGSTYFAPTAEDIISEDWEVME